MEVFKGNGKNNKKGVCTFDFSEKGKHFMLAMDNTGYVIAGFYYDDIEEPFDFYESFTIDKSDMQVYEIFDRNFSTMSEPILFETHVNDLYVEKDDDGYTFHFLKKIHDGNKRILEAKLAFDSDEDNYRLVGAFVDLQSYNPEVHQVHMEEFAKTLNKSKKNIEK